MSNRKLSEIAKNPTDLSGGLPKTPDSKDTKNVSESNAPSETSKSQEQSPDGKKDAPKLDSTMEDLKNYFSSAEIWIFLVIAIIILILCFVMASMSLEWYSGLSKIDWAGNFWIMGIFLVLVVLILAYATFLAYITCPKNHKGFIMMTFIAVMLLTFGWFTVFFNAKSLLNAYYTSLFLLFASILLTYVVWQIDYRFGICTLPFLVFAIFMSGMSWHINDSNTI